MQSMIQAMEINLMQGKASTGKTRMDLNIVHVVLVVVPLVHL